MSEQQINRLGVLKTYKLYIDGKFPRTESGRYFELKNNAGKTLANLCLGSRKDFRDAVTAARGAFSKWSKMSALNRGQIFYRIAEMIETRSSQFIEEMTEQGLSPEAAEKELALAVDRVVCYAGWADKFQQLFSTVNPVASSHFNFSVSEPMGVVGVVAPEDSPLLGLISALAPALVGGNTVVLLASSKYPLTAMTFAEVIHSSDVPAGVVNVLTGYRSELLGQFGTHMDLNAVFLAAPQGDELKNTQTKAAHTIKRVIYKNVTDWSEASLESPYMIQDFQEIKTTWHPIGT